MSTLLYTQNRGPAANDVENVRSTVTFVDENQPESMAPTAPDFNEFESDPYTEGGLTSHMLASKTTGPIKYAPDVVNANDEAALFGIVNHSQSNSGTAAAREMAGEYGHGTLRSTEGIEPTILDGHSFGETYFKATERPVMDTSGHYMTTPPVGLAKEREDVQATGTTNSRAAVTRSMWDAYYNAVTG